MEQLETLCRVCASPGSYDIFGKIPKFLNSARTDIWDQTIAKMIADVTGIPITKNDGLPARVCGLCISYLKHAVGFRNRVVQTRLSLVSAVFVSTKDPDEDFGMHRATNMSKAIETTAELADIQSPENRKQPLHPHSQKVQRFFDYEEKTFVEDDMTQFEAMGIEINHPEVFRERKCGFCLKKFMLEETYDDHLDECLFRTLIEFIKDSNYIVKMKDDTAISNHEFIRRMVFAIQKVHKAIRGMQLPASATLVEEISADFSNSRRSETPPSRTQPPPTTMTPKVAHFFQQSLQKQSPIPAMFTQPPPPLPYHLRKNIIQPQLPNQNYGQSQNYSPSQFIPNRPPPNRTTESTPTYFQMDNFTSINKSPSPLVQKSGPNYNIMSSVAVSVSSSSRGSGYQTPSPTNVSGSDHRGVVCKLCDKTFLTITHLDGHMIKDHT